MSSIFEQATTLWRISNYQTLDGAGGLKYSGRWHSHGRPVVYLADSPASALLEILVHLEVDPERLASYYTLLRVDAGAGLTFDRAEPFEGDTWTQHQRVTQEIGDSWLRQGESCLLQVPSSLLPFTFNYLLNPLHRDASRVSIGGVTENRFDARLFRLHGLGRRPGSGK